MLFYPSYSSIEHYSLWVDRGITSLKQGILRYHTVITYNRTTQHLPKQNMMRHYRDLQRSPLSYLEIAHLKMYGYDMEDYQHNLNRTIIWTISSYSEFRGDITAKMRILIGKDRYFSVIDDQKLFGDENIELSDFLSNKLNNDHEPPERA